MLTEVSGTPTAATPVVSVIIPSYNTATFIGETLESVFAQSFSHYEVIVINDGAPDTMQLEAVLAPFLQRIRYIKQDNLGLAGTRNAGIRAASGEFIAFLDSDDVWLPNFLTEQVAFFRRFPDFDLVYSDAILFGDTPLAGRNFTSISPSNGAVTLEALLSLRCTPVASSVVAKRHIFFDVGMFDVSHRACSEDWECWTRLAMGGVKIGYQTQALMRYRIRKGSLSSNPIALHDGALLALSKLEATGSLSANESQAARKLRTFFTTEIDLHRGKQQLNCGDYSSAKQSFLRVARNHSSSKARIKMWCVVAGLSMSPTFTRFVANRVQPS